MREAPANRLLIVHMRANGHQSLQFDAVQRADLLRGANRIRWIASRLRFLAGFVDLQQHADGDAAGHGPACDLFGQFDRIHRFDGVHHRKDLADFVAL